MWQSFCMESDNWNRWRYSTQNNDAHVPLVIRPLESGEYQAIQNRKRAARWHLAQLILHEWLAQACDNMPSHRGASSHHVDALRRGYGELYRRFVGVLPGQRKTLRAHLQRVAYDGRGKLAGIWAGADIYYRNGSTLSSSSQPLVSVASLDVGSKSSP